MRDSDQANFFIKMFDKYNMSEEGLDAKMTRAEDFEPHASYNDLMEFLNKMKPQNRAQINKKSLIEQSKINKSRDKIEPVKDVLIHILKEEY